MLVFDDMGAELSFHIHPRFLPFIVNTHTSIKYTIGFTAS